MSGGHYNYSFHQVSDFAYSCTLPQSHYDYNLCQDIETPVDNLELREKLAKHLVKVAEIMRAVEWCDSGDTGADTLKVQLEEFLSTLKE